MCVYIHIYIYTYWIRPDALCLYVKFDARF